MSTDPGHVGCTARIAELEAERDATLARAEALEADVKRLNRLEEMDGSALISDDNGHWAVSGTGVQNVVSGDSPEAVATSFFIQAEEWRDSVRAAIDAALGEP